jgi:hypothetical protein
MGNMTCRVIKTFRAWPPGEPNRSRLFQIGEVLENVEYASGAVSLFEVSGAPEPSMYQMPMDEFQQFTEVINFN